MAITQEFYCGECKSYFLVRLNDQLNHEALIVCPNTECNHEHQRCIHDGQIFEKGRFESKVKEKICPMPTSLSKTPLTAHMQKAHEDKSYNARRDGIPVPEPMMDRWLEIAARERGET